MSEGLAARRFGRDPIQIAMPGVAAAVVAILLAVAIVQQGRPLWPPQIVDLPAAALVLASLLLAIRLPLPAALWQGLVRLSQTKHPYLLLAALTFVVLALGTILVLGTTPTTTDEAVPLYQARLFAEFKVITQYPVGFVNAVIPQADQQAFVIVSPEGRAISVYFPGWALLMTPFVWLGAPWMLGPAMGATAVYMIGRLAALLTSARTAAIALMLALASGSFLLTGMSLFPAGGHLTLSLIYVWFVLRGKNRDYFLAGLVGGLALSLNNPFPHAAFAVPWLLWLLLDPTRRRGLVPLCLGYFPGLALIAGWIVLQGSLATPGAAASGSFWSSKLPQLVNFPSIHSVGLRFFEVLTAWSWAAPGVLVLAAAGWWQTRGNVALRLLGVSFVSTVLLYTLSPLDQGVGYGARYFSVAWGGLPILAAVALSSPGKEALCRFALGAALIGALLVVPLQLVYGNVQHNRGAEPIDALSGPGVDLYFVDFSHAGAQETVLANDLSHGARLELVSQGQAIDQSIVDRWFPGSRLVVHNAYGSGYARP